MRVLGNISPWYDVNIGVNKDCGLSTLLFFLYLNKRQKKLRMINGIQVSDRLINCLFYVEDAVFLRLALSELQALITMKR